MKHLIALAIALMAAGPALADQWFVAVPDQNGGYCAPSIKKDPVSDSQFTANNVGKALGIGPATITLIRMQELGPETGYAVIMANFAINNPIPYFYTKSMETCLSSALPRMNNVRRQYGLSR